MSVLQFIQEVLSSPAILIGLISLIGLVLQKSATEDIIKGTIKAIVGFLIIGAGADIVSGSLNSFGDLFNFAFNVQGVVPNNEAIVSLALVDYATDTAYIMALGMIANIVLARFSRLKYIFLTGHHTLYMAALIAVVFRTAGVDGPALWFSGALVLGLTMALFPAIMQKSMRKVTGNDDLAFGHFGSFGYWFAAQVGRLIGKKDEDDSFEEINFPKGLSFMRDTTVAISLTMFILYLIVTVAAYLKDPTILGGENWFLFALTKGLTFAGGVYVILSGVRMLIAEIVPAFKGISEKLVPNAKPALDCPVIFPFAPNSVLAGFLISFAGGVVGLLILYLINQSIPVALILPGVIPHFFCGASAGVFANAEGGKRGVIVGSFLHGLLITFLPILLIPVLGGLGFANTTFSDTDFIVTGIVFGNLALWFKSSVALVVASIVLFLAPIVHNFVARKPE